MSLDLLKNSFNTNYYEDNDNFNEILINENFNLYKVEYSEMEYEEFNKKYFIEFNSKLKSIFSYLSENIFVCFRLFINPINFKCVYQSWWIVNKNLKLNEIIDTNVFIITDLSKNSLEFLKNFNTNSSDEILSEIYLK